MTFRARLTWILLIAVVAVLAATAIGATRASQRIRDDIELARGAHLLNTLKTTIETNLAIGLTLEQMSVLQALVEREKAGAADVLAIDIFAPDATLLYSTDRGAIGSPVGEEWSAQLAQVGTWQLDTPGETVLGARVDNDLGTAAGGIAVTIADSTQAGTLWEDWLPAAKRLAWVTALAVALTLAGALTLNHILMRPLRRATAVLGDPDAKALSATTGTLEQQALLARQAQVAAHARADEGMRRLRELDDAG